MSVSHRSCIVCRFVCWEEVDSLLSFIIGKVDPELLARLTMVLSIMNSYALSDVLPVEHPTAAFRHGATEHVFSSLVVKVGFAGGAIPFESHHSQFLRPRQC